jgi:hypothetical protein
VEWICDRFVLNILFVVVEIRLVLGLLQAWYSVENASRQQRKANRGIMHSSVAGGRNFSFSIDRHRLSQPVWQRVLVMPPLHHSGDSTSTPLLKFLAQDALACLYCPHFTF